MEKITNFAPAFDKRDPNPSQNYGIHGVELRMVLKGELGAVQFVLYTNWQLPNVQEEMRIKMHPDKYFLFEPMPADLGYHSHTAMYEGQEPMTKECEYLNGKPCFYDGSGLNAQRIYDALVSKGSDAVWSELEEYYKSTFDELR